MSKPEDASAIDPVCGRSVDPLRARAVGIFGGTTYYFCSAACKAGYADPRREPRPADPSPPERDARPSPAKTTPPSPRPAVTAAPPPALSAPSAANPGPGSSAAPRMLGALMLVAVVAAVAWLGLKGGQPRTVSRGEPASSPTPAATAATQPPAVHAVPATPPAAQQAASVEKPTVVEDLAAPVKLGLRRFVDREGEQTVVTLRLLIIDASGRAEPIQIARGSVPTAHEGTIAAEAVAPLEPFTSASAESGPIFTDTVQLGESRLELRVLRTAKGISAETRTLPTDGAVQGEGPPWQQRLFAPLPSDATLRAAAFAKKHYLPDPGAE